MPKAHLLIKCFYFILLAFSFTAFIRLHADEKDKQLLKEWLESRAKETKEGWYFPFEEDADSNRFPDDWSRSKNYKLEDGKTLAFASWAEIKLDSKIKKAGKNSLHIISQGAQPIGLETNIFKIDNFAAYELSSWFNIDPVTSKYTKVILGVYWYDSEMNLLPQRTEDNFIMFNTGGWELKKQRINIISESAKFAKLFIRVEGEDTEAKIWIDEVRFSKRPLIILNTNHFLNMFGENEQFKLDIKIRGIEKPKYFIDVSMTNIYNEIVYLNTQSISISNEELNEKKEINFLIQPNEKGSFFDKDRPDRNHLIHGVFTINVVLRDDKEDIGGNSIRIGRTEIVNRNRIKDDGEVFGVTIKNLNNSFQLRKGLDLLGVMRVKIPVWDESLEWEGTQFKPNEFKSKLGQIIKEVRTGENQPEIVGVFGPRPKVIEKNTEKGVLNLIAGDEKKWSPYFESTIYNYRTSIKVWQLGDDADFSFTNDEKQQLLLEKLNPYLEKAGQVGAATKILSNPSISNKQLRAHHWLMFNDFEYTDDLNFEELEKALPKSQETFAPKKWLSIPLKSKLYLNNDLNVSVDLIKKIVWARKNDIKRIFVSNYQDEFYGLINHKDEITPAFLSYKLCVDQLSEVNYMGSLPEFGEEIQNFVFSLKQNPKKAVLVAWTKRSDTMNPSYDFTENTLVKINKKLEDLISDLKKPDAVLNHQLIEFFPELISDNSRSHFVKGLNNIIDNPIIRKTFLEKYEELGVISKSPLLKELIKNKFKNQNQEKQTTRYILEELYPNCLNTIETIQKDILLDQEIDQVDLMGNSTPVNVKWSDGDPFQEIKVNQYPTFYTGLSSDFINTRISIRLDESVVLYSRLEKQKQTIIVKNYFDQPMDGIFIINYPPSWKNFNPFIKFRIEKGEPEKKFDFWIIPSRIANPGTVSIGLKTSFTTDRKYSFRSERETALVSDLIVGKPNEKIAIVPPKFGDANSKYVLNIPISLKPFIEGRPKEIDLVVSLDLPDGETSMVRLDKIQSGTYRVAPFSIKLKKEFNNKIARVRIEQRGSSADSLIFHNLDIPIPDAE